VKRTVALLAVLAAAFAAPADALERLPAVLHVHSDLSTGDFSLEQLAGMAERHGIGALLVTENYLLRVEYGLLPFRALTRVVREERSVLDAGVDRYLANVERARASHPRVLIVAGVEVLPHYFWSGSPLMLDMTAHNTQKNLLVLGLDAGALHALPVTGNPVTSRYGWASVLDALPAVLLVPGVVLLARRRRALRPMGRVVVVVARRRWLAGAVLCGVGVAALARGWPFTLDPYPPYRDLGLTPHQDLIDYVDRAGGVTVWSFPEARDEGERRIGPVRVAWRTPPSPDDLLRTSNYTAFGAVYEDTTHVERPGGGWDRLLGQFASGNLSRPAWGVGESGFHGFSAGKDLGTVRTVFLVEERSERAVLDALKGGRMYAVQRARETELVLAGFTARAGSVSATSGETLRVASPISVAVSVDVESTGAPVRDIRAILVKNGAVVAVWNGPAPIRAVHQDVFDGAPTFYRLDVRGPGRLLSNPIFVKRAGRAAPDGEASR
jgi:hypothetical protein